MHRGVRLQPLFAVLLATVMGACTPLTVDRDAHRRGDAEETGAPEMVSPPDSETPAVTVSRVQRGKAAFYSDVLHGKPTASGEIYNRNKLTAAHPRLPFGTVCRVTNLANGKTVEVRINDRCSEKMGRIVDLSYEAMARLDAIPAGVIDVKLEVIHSRSQ